ncbi:sensor histidine kinase [Ideonella livida]|uniref:histidine kinase n=1 Tax=Ideonella livida TaxID=2707176 RepID=A0A7C9PFY4_9BURK|nr:histidine kinase [Ideonella livida]NDY90936.1 sensor histidine kinase [Ideonella livida]
MPSDVLARVHPRWRRLSLSCLRAFHAYASWLVAMRWRRFLLLSLLLMIGVSVLQNLPPFSWTISETVETPPSKPRRVAPPAPPAPPSAPAGVKPLAGAAEVSAVGPLIILGPSSAASAGEAASSPKVVTIDTGHRRIRIELPADPDGDAVREAIGDVAEALRGAAEDAAAEEEAAAAADEVVVTRHRLGDGLTDLAFLWIVASAIVKITYRGQLAAEAQAAQATEAAEAEALKRQVIEARMAAMQAQVEPHFLFNTLASIEHLIETDPPRAAQMQRNLISLLRASMPTLRETGQDSACRDLEREMAMVRPYIEILKVRMEDRLQAHIEVPDGLLSAEFPGMMLQTLVENAIRHGLEPKAEGGRLQVSAEVRHGRLRVSVLDSGVGLGRSSASGTGIGLANIRERLQLLYGGQASLTLAAPEGGGTVASIELPYRVSPNGAAARHPPA